MHEREETQPGGRRQAARADEKGTAVAPMTRILIVEDEQITARDIADSLVALGYEVVGSAANADEALALAGEHRPDIVLLDIVLQGDRDGISLSSAFRSDFGIPVVFLTAHTDESVFERAKITEPFGYLIKPFEDHELKIAIEMALYKHRAETELRRSHERFRNLMEYAADAFVIHDTGGAILDVNQFACRLIGRDRAELLAMRVQDITAPRDKEILLDVWGSLTHGEPAQIETLCLRPDGKTFPIEARLGLLESSDSKVVLAIFRDITERKLLEYERERLIRDLKGTVDTMKSMRSMLPICVTKKRFSSPGDVEKLIKAHYDAVLTGGVCHECIAALRRAE
jgi:PAS domain S-box-containing protein